MTDRRADLAQRLEEANELRRRWPGTAFYGADPLIDEAAAELRRPAADEVEEMAKRLDVQAESESRVSKMMADDKSGRNGYEPGAYMWSAPEQTVSGKAAALLRRLSPAEDVDSSRPSSAPRDP